MLSKGQVGLIAQTDGQSTILRAGKTGELISSQLHGRYYEQNYRGNVYSGGMTLAAITNAIWTSATVDATAKPIVGLWNPLNSGVNAVLLKAMLGITVTAATVTGGAPFVWMKGVGESAISTGTTPINQKTLAASGSLVKDMSGIALTGKVANLAFLRGSHLSGGSLANFSFVGTAAGQVTPQFSSIEQIDGDIIVPPGGVIGLFATTTPVALSAASGLVWEEVAV